MTPSSPYSSRANDWENGTFVTFIDSIESFGEDSDMITNEPSWRNFAQLLYAGK